MSIDESKYVSFVKRNLKLLQPSQIFILESSPSMMLFLILNVTNDCTELGVSVRKRAVTSCQQNLPRTHFFLLMKSEESALMSRTTTANAFDGFKPIKNVHMIRHTLDGDQFLTLVADNTRHVLVKLFFELRTNERQPPVNCEDSLNVDLGVGVGHEVLTFRS